MLYPRQLDTVNPPARPIFASSIALSLEVPSVMPNGLQVLKVRIVPKRRLEGSTAYGTPDSVWAQAPGPGHLMP